MPLAELVAAGIAWWLGLYVLVRNPQRPLMRRAAAGLLSYALTLVFQGLARAAPASLAAGLSHGSQIMMMVPALCWAGALLLLVPHESPWRARLDRGWLYGILPLALLLLLLREFGWRSAWFDVLVVLVGFVPMLIGVVLIGQRVWSSRTRSNVLILGVGLLFGGLSSGLVLILLGWLVPRWAILALGLDLLLLGLLIAQIDAFDEGERLRYHLVRSATAAALSGTLFGLPLVVLGFYLSPTFPLVLCLWITVGLAVSLPTLADPLARVVDQVVFAQAPQLQQQRSMLREVASALPRIEPTHDLAQLDESEFARLVRRALSHYGDLPRLATSPLIQLPQIQARLAARQAVDDPLERALELKLLLAESIDRLKPRGGDGFGTSDEWRFYNALYFPYVVGLRPYSQRSEPYRLDAVAQTALDWMRQAVPERTLYNWQNSAARLIAQELRRQATSH